MDEPNSHDFYTVYIIMHTKLTTYLVTSHQIAVQLLVPSATYPYLLKPLHSHQTCYTVIHCNL